MEIIISSDNYLLCSRNLVFVFRVVLVNIELETDYPSSFLLHGHQWTRWEEGSTSPCGWLVRRRGGVRGVLVTRVLGVWASSLPAFQVQERRKGDQFDC